MRDLIQRGSERRRHREAVETRSRETLGLDPIAGEVVPFRRTVVPGLKRMVG